MEDRQNVMKQRIRVANSAYRDVSVGKTLSKMPAAVDREHFGFALQFDSDFMRNERTMWHRCHKVRSETAAVIINLPAARSLAQWNAHPREAGVRVKTSLQATARATIGVIFGKNESCTPYRCGCSISLRRVGPG